MHLFKKPPEVDETLRLLTEARAAFGPELSFLVDHVVDEARKVLTINRQTAEEYAKDIREGKSTPKEWVYTYIINDAADKMESGTYHVYRGLLDQTGKAYGAIMERAISIMVESGAYTSEWADQNIRQPVYRNVKTVG
jgi:hypothetical protein